MSYEINWSQNKSLNKIEMLKLKKDGLEIIDAIIQKYAKAGCSGVPADDIDLFKWAGLYEQRPRNGHFMLRVRMDSGIMSSQQAKVLSHIAQKYGKGIANITTRGSIQFHWIRLDAVPDIFRQLAACGLSSFEACGDCPRTIVGNPLAGIDKYELINAAPIINEISSFFLLNRDFSNLPRKFKISISGSMMNAAHAQINDIAFTPAIKYISGEHIAGFNVWAGGGLSSTPHLARKLDIFARPGDVFKITRAACTIFRDCGPREKRTRARLKFLIDDWGVEKFRSKLFELTGALPDSGADMSLDWNAAYYYGIHAQKQPGKSYAGLHIPFGRITGEELSLLADISEAYGDKKLRTTLSQNIIISGIKNECLPGLLKKDIFSRLPINPGKISGYTIACTGREFCNLAAAETKNNAERIIRYLESRVKVDQPVRIHFIGCPNSCGQKQIADISLQGGLIKTETGSEEAFSVWIGGNLIAAGKFAEKISGLVKASEVQFLLEKILLFYKSDSLPGENFTSFMERTDGGRLEAAIAGQPQAAGI